MADTHYLRPARPPARSAVTLWRPLGTPRLSRIRPDYRRLLKLLWRGYAVEAR